MGRIRKEVVCLSEIVRKNNVSRYSIGRLDRSVIAHRDGVIVHWAAKRSPDAVPVEASQSRSGQDSDALLDNLNTLVTISSRFLGMEVLQSP